MSNDTAPYYLYILLCDKQVLYTGIALDPAARLIQHQTGRPHGAKFTRRFTQLELVYQVKIGSRAHAQKFEYYLKQCTRKKKFNIINIQPSVDELTGLLLPINLN